MRILTASVLMLTGMSCSTGSSAPEKSEIEVVVSVHPKAAWYPYRAKAWGLSLADAMERDHGFGRDSPPPSSFWDAQVAVESATIWRVMCNECHRGQRRIGSALEIPAPGEAWGLDNGRFFGHERPYRDMHLQISIGGDAKPEVNSRMPGFGDELSNEQIWGLIYFIEQSGKDIPQR